MTAPTFHPEKRVLPAVALTLACVGIILGPLSSVPAIICGHIALTKKPASDSEKGKIVAAICVGYGAIVLWFLVALPLVFTIGATAGLKH